MKGEEMINRIRRVQLEILDEVIAILEVHQLVYALDGGTLIGSFVNGGFGEFDDDIDIAMPRKDYERLVEIVSEGIASDIYAEEQRLVKGYHLVFMKVRKRGTHYTLDDLETEEEIFIDIFPLDYVSSDKGFLLKAKQFVAQKLKAIIFLKKVGKLHQGTRIRKVRQVAVKALVPISANIAYKICQRIIIQSESEFLTNYSGKRNRRGSCPFCINDYFPLKKGLFEGKTYNIPSNPQRIIEKIYGSKGIQLYQEKNKYRHLNHKIDPKS